MLTAFAPPTIHRKRYGLPGQYASLALWCTFTHIYVSAVSISDWNALNASVNHRLYSASPFALPCFSDYNNNRHQIDPTACSAIQQGYTDSIFRSPFYGSQMQVRNILSSILRSSCIYRRLLSRNGKLASH
jgi:hypothetical protein